MKYTPEQIGQLVKKARKTLGVTQKDRKRSVDGVWPSQRAGIEFAAERIRA